MPSAAVNYIKHMYSLTELLIRFWSSAAHRITCNVDMSYICPVQYGSH